MTETDSASSSCYSMIDFVDELKTKFEIKDDFDFSILVEKSPIKKKYTFCCKVLAIMISGLKTIPYDEIVAKDLRYVEVKENSDRKIGTRNFPFFIDGNSKIEIYKENEFVKYNFRNASKKDLTIVEKLRTKFNIPEPIKFKGKVLHLNDDII